MSAVRADNIIEQDDDYNADGVLKATAKASYEDKYGDLDFLDDLNANTDNDLGSDELDDIPDPDTEEDSNFDD